MFNRKSNFISLQCIEEWTRLCSKCTRLQCFWERYIIINDSDAIQCSRHSIIEWPAKQEWMRTGCKVYWRFSNGDGRGSSRHFVKSPSQTISVQEATQRPLQDGCSSNTSHIWQVRQHATNTPLILHRFPRDHPSPLCTVHRITVSRRRCPLP